MFKKLMGGAGVAIASSISGGIYSVVVDAISRETPENCNTLLCWNTAFFCDMASWGVWGAVAYYLYLRGNNEANLGQLAQTTALLTSSSEEDSPTEDEDRTSKQAFGQIAESDVEAATNSNAKAAEETNPFAPGWGKR